MYTINQYVKVDSLAEAYELNQQKTNRILGGTMWLRLSAYKINKAIDLTKLGLDKITETDEAFVIGCMTPLRQLELSESLNDYTNGAIRESLKHIVGTQFRNGATIGGSIFGRFGFSDILTCLLVLDCEVELYKAGRISLADFVNMQPDNDVLVNVIIRKTPCQVVYQSLRNSATDFPVVACAVSRSSAGTVRTAIGARPGKAVLTADKQEMVAELSAAGIEEYAQSVAAELAFAGNMRGSAEYRRAMTAVLIKRSLLQLAQQKAEV